MSTASNPKGTKFMPEYDTEHVVGMFSSAQIHMLGAWLDANLPVPARGARSPFDGAGLLAVAAIARITGSNVRAVKAVSQPETWELCRKEYADVRSDGRVLPRRPPTIDQIRTFRKHITSTPEMMEGLQHAFRRSSIWQAQKLGNLQRTAGLNWARPNPRNLIYGDGTVVRPYSSARWVAHPTDKTRKVLHGSRAADPRRARVQNIWTDVSQDDKQAIGGNFVAVHTWTEWGRVCLGTDLATGAEQWPALRIIDALVELVGPGGGIDSVLWDRALTGWTTDYLMAKHGIQLVGKSVAVYSDSSHDKTIRATEIKDRLAQMTLTLNKALNKLDQRVLREDAIKGIIADGPATLGRTIYRTKSGRHDLVGGRHEVLAPVSHRVGSEDCVHHLAVDDGALYVVDPVDEIKLARARCISATRITGATGFGTLRVFEIPCEHGDFTYTRAWFPSTRRGSLASAAGSEPDARDTISQLLRPLSRADGAAFDAVHGRRNDAESFNAEFKRTITHHGGAASLSRHAQQLDFLMAAVVTNARTWNRRCTDTCAQ